MASNSHDEDEMDEFYAPDNDNSDMEYNFDTDSEDADFENEIELNHGDISMDFEEEGQLSGYISQSSCHSLNTGSDSEGVSYHMGNEFNCERQANHPSFEVGLSFKNMRELRMMLKQYAIRKSFDIKYVKNSRSRITAICTDENCKWRLHASMLPDGETIEIKNLNENHTCVNINQVGNHMASVDWIVEKIKFRLKTDVSVKPKVLSSEVFREYGVKIPYLKMWRAKEKAIHMLRGSFEESYRMIPSLYKTILKYNPGSIVHYDTEDDGSFQRFFVAFSASLQGFLNGCCPFIGLDGTFLKGKFKGILLTAIALDANKQIFPLCFAVVEGENKDSWTFFLQNLRNGIGNSPFTFMSDRQKGLVEAVNSVFPRSHHRFCMRHLYANFQKIYKGEQLRNLFWTASRAYTMSEFDSAMNEIGAINSQAKEWIEKIPPVFWSRAFFPDVLPCNQNQNNFTECFNNLILESRSMPICDMIEWIRVKLMVSMQTRRSKSSHWEGVVCPTIKKMLKDRQEKSHHCDLFFAGGHEYEILEHRVFDDDIHHIVKLLDKNCTCRQWQLDGVPCMHAMSAIAHRREKFEDYCHPCYFTSTYQACYELIIHPLPNRRMWEYFQTPPVLPPHNRRPPGRPRVNRRKDPDEASMSSQHRQRRKQTVKCGLCGQFGHNRRSCKEPINASQAESTSRGRPRVRSVGEGIPGGRRIKMTIQRRR